ncbi:MAG: hypothetical protein P8Y97_04100 [Candidatus Lokiarchaeota archaeon]
MVTGFLPFSSYNRNLSQVIVNKLPNIIAEQQIVKKILPVSWDQSLTQYKKVLNITKKRPNFCILLGIHSKSKISIEKFSYNWKFGLDIHGKFKFGFIKLGKPFLKSTKIDVENILYELERISMKIKIQVSRYPGFYLCNYIYFWAQICSNNKYPVIFIHIPHKADKDIEFEIRAIIKKLIHIIIQKKEYKI